MIRKPLYKPRAKINSLLSSASKDNILTELKLEDDHNSTIDSGLPPKPRRSLPKRPPTSTELLKDFITRNLPEMGSMLAANETSTDERAVLMAELHRDFFISP